MTEPDRFYGEPLARFDAMASTTHSDPIDAAHFRMWCKIAADEIRHARELQHKAETDTRHWREEVGKLNAKLRNQAVLHASTSPGPVNCNAVLQAQGNAHPRTCERCGLGPCPFFDKDGNSLRAARTA